MLVCYDSPYPVDYSIKQQAIFFVKLTLNDNSQMTILFIKPTKREKVCFNLISGVVYLEEVK
ncbi:unnamed protein product [Citrullus colocynthis]|uniref:Uncharacterized protein n=1 Tax=Citrullus colocynthis TaxID=252529 RepID=A0ABP0YZZ0_9ROSI